MSSTNTNIIIAEAFKEDVTAVDMHILNGCVQTLKQAVDKGIDFVEASGLIAVALTEISSKSDEDDIKTALDDLGSTHYAVGTVESAIVRGVALVLENGGGADELLKLSLGYIERLATAFEARNSFETGSTFGGIEIK